MTKEPMEQPQRAGERIAKVMARVGLCSRRDAETWISLGRVSVNGQVLESAALNIGPKDVVLVDGKPLPGKQQTRVWLYYKPKGLMTTAHDPEGRATVFENLPDGMPRVISIGRLDLNSEGLLLLTNDGDLARQLELPASALVRRYRVRINGRIDPKILEGLKNGIEIEGVRYGPIEAAMDRQQGANAWLSMALTEGKNREIRRICQHLGWPVSRLIRIAYGPFQLGEMEPGATSEIKGKLLRDQLKFGNDWRPELSNAVPEGTERQPDRRMRQQVKEPAARSERPDWKKGDRKPADAKPAGTRHRDRNEPDRRERPHAREQAARSERPDWKKGDRKPGGGKSVGARQRDRSEPDRRERQQAREQATRSERPDWKKGDRKPGGGKSVGAQQRDRSEPDRRERPHAREQAARSERPDWKPRDRKPADAKPAGTRHRDRNEPDRRERPQAREPVFRSDRPDYTRDRGGTPEGKPRRKPGPRNAGRFR